MNKDVFEEMEKEVRKRCEDIPLISTEIDEVIGICKEQIKKMVENFLIDITSDLFVKNISKMSDKATLVNLGKIKQALKRYGIEK